MILDTLLIRMGLDARSMTSGAQQVETSLDRIGAGTQKVGKDMAGAFKKGTDQVESMRRSLGATLALLTGGRMMKGFISDVTQAGVAMGQLAGQINVDPKTLTKYGGAVESLGGNRAEIGNWYAGLQAKNATPEGQRELAQSAVKMGVEGGFFDENGKIKKNLPDLINHSKVFQGLSRPVRDFYLRETGATQGIANLESAPDYDERVSKFSGHGPDEKDIKIAQKLADDWTQLRLQMEDIERGAMKELGPRFHDIAQALLAVMKAHPDAIANTITALGVGLTALSGALAAKGVLKLLGLGKGGAKEAASFIAGVSGKGCCCEDEPGTSEGRKKKRGGTLLGSVVKTAAAVTGVKELGDTLLQSDAVQESLKKQLAELTEQLKKAKTPEEKEHIQRDIDRDTTLLADPSMMSLLVNSFERLFPQQAKQAKDLSEHDPSWWKERVAKVGIHIPALISSAQADTIPQTERDKNLPSLRSPISERDAQPGGKEGGVQAIARQFYASQGYTQEQISGLLARMHLESKGDPTAKGDHGAAYGLFQWHKDRRNNFKAAFGHEMGAGDWKQQLMEQLQFSVLEMKTPGWEKGAGDALLKTKTAAEAGDVVSRQFIRPGLDPADKDREAVRTSQLAMLLDRTQDQSVPTAPSPRHTSDASDPSAAPSPSLRSSDVPDRSEDLHRVTRTLVALKNQATDPPTIQLMPGVQRMAEASDAIRERSILRTENNNNTTNHNSNVTVGDINVTSQAADPRQIALETHRAFAQSLLGSPTGLM